jgi:hypothetical protein
MFDLAFISLSSSLFSFSVFKLQLILPSEPLVLFKVMSRDSLFLETETFVMSKPTIPGESSSRMVMRVWVSSPASL